MDRKTARRIETPGFNSIKGTIKTRTEGSMDDTTMSFNSIKGTIKTVRP